MLSSHFPLQSMTLCSLSCLCSDRDEQLNRMPLMLFRIYAQIHINLNIFFSVYWRRLWLNYCFAITTARERVLFPTASRPLNGRHIFSFVFKSKFISAKERSLSPSGEKQRQNVCEVKAIALVPNVWPNPTQICRQFKFQIAIINGTCGASLLSSDRLSSNTLAIEF